MDFNNSNNNKSYIDNLIKIEKRIMNYNEFELNTLQYEEAIKFDKRTYIQFYLSLLKTKHLLIFAFHSNDYNSRSIKIFLFFFSFTLYYTVNALFFSDSTMHQIYEDEGSFNFVYQIPQILYSSLISSVLNSIIKTLSLSEKNVLQVKHEPNLQNLDKRAKDVLKCLFQKFLIFFILSLGLLLLFWYYLSCFCAVYKNTQLHLIKDSVISFGLSLLYPIGLYLLPGIFRIPSLRAVKKDKETMFKFSKVIQLI